MLASVAAKPSLAHEGEAGAAFTGDQASLTEVLAFQADDRSARIEQGSASEDPTASDLAAIDRVWASLAEVLGSQIEESPPAFEASERQAAAPKRDVAVRASVGLAAVDPVPVASASPIYATSNDSSSLKRSSEADDIVVASSHSDKILLSLAALRSGEDSEMGRSGAQTKKTVVVAHPTRYWRHWPCLSRGKSKRAAFSCTRAAEEETQIATPSEPMEPWESRNRQLHRRVPRSRANPTSFLTCCHRLLIDQRSLLASSASPASAVRPALCTPYRPKCHG